MGLDERKAKILSSIVEDYISSAEPVGSKTISQKYNNEFSPATIRNEMKLLEDDGYLEQPHISAGRIPSTKGYRYYVDNLMKDKKLSMIEINYINNSITGYGDTEGLLEQAATTVSKILERPTILTISNSDILEKIKILRISENILLVILVSQNGVIKDCIAKISNTIPDNVVEELNNMLNVNLKGTPIEDLYNVLNLVITKELKGFSNILAQICQSIKYELSRSNKNIKNNVESILDLPEFSDIDKARDFINLISTKQIIDNTLQVIPDKKLSIIIGNENKEVLLKDYSIISLNIVDNKKMKSSLSIISPKRIDYSKTVSTLKYINGKMRNLFINPKKQ